MVFWDTSKRKLGKAELAYQRLVRILIPLSNQLYWVRIESCVASYGRRSTLLKKLIGTLFRFVIFQSNYSELVTAWRRFYCPYMSKPGYDFPWQEPDFEKVEQIMIQQDSLVWSELRRKWFRLVESYREDYPDLTEDWVDFIRYARSMTEKTKLYLEKKYPSVLAKST